MSKLSDNYIAVNENRMSKSEFLRQSRQLFPSMINQFTSYNDAISILRGKELLSEEVIYRCLGDKFPLEQIDNGIRYELEQVGIYSPMLPERGDYVAAKKKAIDNLVKDSLYYVKKAACYGKECVADKEESDKMKKVPLQETQNSKKTTKRIDDKESKLLKEAITRTISKVLSEAATTNLASISDSNASIQGVPAILNSLENVVTEIESFIIKEQAKIQGIFDGMGNIKSEDGIPIGYRFVDPVVEAFRKDLKPVLDKVTLDNIKLPKAPEDIQNTSSDLDGAELNPEEKKTMFAPKGEKPNPLAESKQPKKRYTK